MPFYADQSRSDLRRAYAEAWRKSRDGLPLQPVEAQLADVIQQHPEYHRILESDSALEREWAPEQGESNPFLHMGLHLAVRDQIATDRPTGIRHAFEQLASRLASSHDAEHQVIECLATALWNAQRSQLPPDEHAYLEAVIRLAKR